MRVLNAVYEHFRSTGQRAEFGDLDKQLDLEGARLRPLAESMPPGLLIPNVASRGGFFRKDDRLMVTVEGLWYCEHGGEALDLLARSLAYLAKREKPFVPSAAHRDLRVTSAEIERELQLTSAQLEQVLQMLHEYEWQAYAQTSDHGAGSWDLVVATEYVRRFRGIRDGAQYLRARGRIVCAPARRRRGGSPFHAYLRAVDLDGPRRRASRHAGRRCGPHRDIRGDGRRDH